MADYEIPVFKGTAPTAKPIQPERVPNLRQRGTWVITPKGMFGDDVCAHLIDLLRKRKVNALIINERGVLEFGVVERSDGDR